MKNPTTPFRQYVAMMTAVHHGRLMHGWMAEEDVPSSTVWAVGRDIDIAR